MYIGRFLVFLVFTREGLSTRFGFGRYYSLFELDRSFYYIDSPTHIDYIDIE